MDRAGTLIDLRVDGTASGEGLRRPEFGLGDGSRLGLALAGLIAVRVEGSGGFLLEKSLRSRCIRGSGIRGRRVICLLCGSILIPGIADSRRIRRLL